MLTRILIGLIIVFCSSLSGWAEDISLTASVDRKIVQLGESIQLTLKISGTQQVPAPQIDGGDVFQVSYRGPSTQISIVNGRMSSSISHIYSLVPLKTGRHVIGPFKIKIKGKTYSTQPIIIEVRKGAILRDDRRSGFGGELSLEDLVYLKVLVDKDEVYMNEEVPVNIKLYFRGVSLTDIQYPGLESEGFSKGKFGQPYQGKEVIDGFLFDVVEFKTVVYPVVRGQLTLGPAELKCNLLIKTQRQRRNRGFFDDFFFDDDFFDNFFNRYQRRPLTLKSEPVQITVKPLPEENKPEGFSGAVGYYDFQVKVYPKEVKVGEPITLTMKIKGRGNLQAVSAPKIPGPENFKVYEPQVKTDIAKDKVYIEGEKTFEQVLIPTETSVKYIPEITFSYFEPQTEKYQIIKRGPIPITVTAAPEEEEPVRIVGLPSTEKKLLPEETLGRDIVYIKTTPGRFRLRGSRLYKNQQLVIVYVLPPLALITAIIYRRKKDRLTQDIKYARLQRASTVARRGLTRARKVARQGRYGESLDIVYKMVQQYLGDRFNLASAGITSQIVADLAERNVPEDIQKKIKDFFELCDAARFAPTSEISEVLNQAMFLAKEIVSFLEKNKNEKNI